MVEEIKSIIVCLHGGIFATIESHAFKDRYEKRWELVPFPSCPKWALTTLC